MQHIDLCAGIGGFSLAADWMGWHTIAWVEKDPYCQVKLQKNFPDADAHSDLYDFDGTPYRGQCDLLTAGFPCQPFSVAGQRRGAADDRHLWPQVVRVLREVQPQWCVFENVTGLLSMVEPDSTPPVEIETAELFHQADGAKAIQFERTERRIIGNILDDLEQAGYLPLRAADGTPILLVVPACAVGAIHRRDRVWVIAYTDRERQQQQLRTFPESRRRAKYCRQAANPHPDSTRRQKLNVPTESARQRLNTGLLDFSPAEWQPHNTSELIQAAYGLPGRVARRSAQIRAYGNAIHPGVAYQIFQAIQSTAP